jgi:hypothetical protein
LSQFSPGTRLRLLAWGAGQVVRHGRPALALGFLGSIGDDLLCTAPVDEWRRRQAGRIWFFSRHPDLHRLIGPQVSLIPDDPRFQRLAARLGRPMRALGYSTFDPITDRDTPLREHIIADMCRRAGLSGTVRLRPHLKLAPSELADAAAWNGCVAVQSSSLTAALPMQNKQWRLDRLQKVTGLLVARGERVVQIGTAGDPVLHGAADLRGKTSLRQTAAILAQARLFVGIVGFVMHLARAVECPAVIVYGGREPPALTGYLCNINVVGRTPCSPCWQRNRCDFEHACMETIAAAQVADAVEDALSRPRGPLFEETAMIGNASAQN